MSHPQSDDHIDTAQAVTGHFPSQQRDKPRTFLKAILGLLACVGLIALLTVGYVIVDAKGNPETPQHIDPSAANGGELLHVSQPYLFSATLPLKPEQVKFNFFSEKHWGWVLKHDYQSEEYQRTINEVLIADEEEIHVAARFESANDNTRAVRAKHGSCESADLAHSSWEAKTSAETIIETGDKSVESQLENSSDTDNEPLRCTKYRIAYRTDSLGGKFVTPLYLLFSGMRDGSSVDGKNVKVMFDNKSYTYLLPKEMELDVNG